ncbi:GNAT family N-acetyltransferase [bacterium]|nr:GNAT family N-acetyltransferase [bacterium]
MRISEYTNSLRDNWNNFLKNSNNGTIFAHQSFFDYHPPERFKHRHLMFYDAKGLVALFPCAEVERDGEKILVSHPGASFGGFVLREKTGISEALSLVDELLRFAKDKNYSGVEMTLPPWIYYKFPENHIDFALFNKGAGHRKRELTAVVPIYDDFEKNISLFRPTARTAMRKAQKNGIEIRQSEDFVAFYRILEKNLSMRHGVAPTHTIDEIIRLKELLPENIELISAFLDDKMIAGTLLFICNERTILAFYISQDYEHQNLRPLNLLFAEVIRWASKKKFRWLDFGTYTLNNVPNLGLARFKESLGAKGIFRDTLFYPIS